MNFDDWFDIFQPVANPGRCGFEINDVNFMFETFGKDQVEVTKVENIDGKLVWTLVECESGEMLIEGYHRVNRIGHFIATVPWYGGQKTIPFS